MSAAVVVRRCAPPELLALRHAVLRPHVPADEVGFAEDDGAASAHFGAEAAGAGLVSIASVWPEEAPWDPAARPAWRLRAMATAPQWRGQGAGSLVLAATIDHVAAHGGGLFWCNARLAAVAFYERAGLVGRGEIFEVPVIGPHLAMSKHIDPVPPR